MKEKFISKGSAKTSFCVVWAWLAAARVMLRKAVSGKSLTGVGMKAEGK